MSDQDGPLVRVVRGEPTDEELAVLVAVLTALASALAPAPEVPAQRTAAGDRALWNRTEPANGYRMPASWR